MEPKSSLSDKLRAADGALILGADGRVLEITSLSEPESPVLLVAPVTDALKTVSDDGFVTGSLDRETTWKVVGYQIDGATREHLAAMRDMEVDQIFHEIHAMGLTWEARLVDEGSWGGEPADI